MGKPFDEIELESASEPVQKIFRDIQFTLRFKDVPWLFRALGKNEVFLEAAWRAIKPLVTDAFDASADQIRSEAVSQVAESFETGKLGEKLRKSGLDEGSLDLFIETALAYHYVTPKLLIIALALQEALADKQPSVQSIVVMPTGRGLPHGMPDIKRIGEDAGSAELKEYMKSRSLSITPDFLGALCQWPDALGVLWTALDQAGSESEHQALQEKLRGVADTEVDQLRRRMDLGKEELEELGIGESDRKSIIEIVDAARDLYLKSLIDVSHSALMIAGPEAAALSCEEFLLRWRFPRKAPVRS